MLRKWEYIKDQCFKREFKEAAKVAGEIDVILLENYDTEHTPKWITYCQHTMTADLVSYKVLKGIATTPRYCIACIASERNCWECRFAKLCGICGDSDSLYMRFFTELDKAWKEVLE